MTPEEQNAIQQFVACCKELNVHDSRLTLHETICMRQYQWAASAKEATRHKEESVRLAARLEALRLQLCQTGLPPEAHPTPEHAAQAVAETIRNLRRQLESHPPDKELVIMKLSTQRDHWKAMALRLAETTTNLVELAHLMREHVRAANLEPNTP